MVEIDEHTDADLHDDSNRNEDSSSINNDEDEPLDILDDTRTEPFTDEVFNLYDQFNQWTSIVFPNLNPIELEPELLPKHAQTIVNQCIDAHYSKKNYNNCFNFSSNLKLRLQSNN